MIKVDQAQSRFKRMKRAVLGVGDCLASRRSRCRWLMVTLTLRPGVQWEAQMIRAYIARVRDWARRRGIELPYLWVAELQASRLRDYSIRCDAAVHYHVIFRLPIGITMPKADKQGWWPHGMSKTEVARKPVGYLAKYVSKGDEQQFPRGIRIFGLGGLDHGTRDFRRWWCAPLYVRGQIGPQDRPMRCAGGYLARETGEFALTPYSVHLRRNAITHLYEVWISIEGDPSDAKVAEWNATNIARSRRFAMEAGYHWLPKLPTCAV